MMRVPALLTLAVALSFGPVAPASSPLLPVAQQPTPDPLPPTPYGSCEGHVNGATLTCTENQCPGGCYQKSVSTPLGPAMVCACRYIGPDPGCCTIALTEGGGYTTWGNCPTFCSSNGADCFNVPDDEGMTAFCYSYW